MQHEDFQEEQLYLHHARQYMEEILRDSARDLKTAQDNIRTSIADLDYLDSSLSYLNILANARFFEMAQTQQDSLLAVKNRPYFARIDFQRDDSTETEQLYIGKTSLFHRDTHEPIIVDWRSPIANVYYDGRLGHLSYDVRGEEYSGELHKKRQYKIEHGELLDIRDVDLTTTDELLQEALAGKADVRLTEIVSTIQKEQNDIMRAHLKQPIIVQGAAGSGKTTIALHRISYFLYTMGEHFKAEDLMILTPSKLFIHYIADVLPDLGVGNIRQTTYAQYVKDALKLNVKIAPTNDVLEQLIEEKEHPFAWIVKLKGSLQFKQLLDRYVMRLEHEMAEQFEDIFLEKYRLIKKARLQKLFVEEFAYLPIEKRLARIKKVIQADVKRKEKAVYDALSQRYEATLDKILNGIRDQQKRRRLIFKYTDERDERLPQIKEEARTKTASYMRRFKKVNVKTMYRELLTNPMLLAELAYDWTFEQQSQFLAFHKKETWHEDDVAALYYLAARIKGIDEKHKVKVVFIDEVQDYSLLQLAALQAGLETDMFTMVGDLAQGIHSYRSLTNWHDVQQLFPRATYATLQKSYRTTIDIMHVANDVLGQMDEELPLVEPVVRRGETPRFVTREHFDVTAIADEVARMHQNGFRSVALICKSTNDALRYEQLLEEGNVAVQRLTTDSALDQQKLLIVPSHLAKGLEFDAVIVVATDTPFYNAPLDRKLLYVALTRAMHALTLIGPSTDAFLLQHTSFVENIDA
ncbi:MAG: ATP-binding domain-containing protein [Caryophanon sp.]|nr:ATP-binding domain-containing protein [Caryophanon sp.]